MTIPTYDRREKVSSLLKEIAADFIRNEASSNPLITVTRADVSPDYKRATIYVTTIPDSGEEDAMIFLKRKGTDMRTYVKRHSTLRYLPRLDFAIDRGERHRQDTDEVFNKIKLEKK